MSASTFTVYTSSDPGNGSDQPGLLTGQAGDLLRVLDKVLVNGYTGKAAAGWSKPFANATNSGCYKQGAGALCALHIQDNGANVTSTFKEAWATGWETITATSATVGTGTGQFPTPAQLLTTGHVVIRKSNTADGTGRPWIIFADSTTFYLFVLSGEAASTYNAFYFGDIFAMKGSGDAYRCIIHGNGVENSGAAATGQTVDQIFTFGATVASQIGAYMPRSFGGGGTSLQVQKSGDYGKFNQGAGTVCAMAGAVQSPNGPDNSFYMVPVQIWESVSFCIRGRLRGVYQVCHAVANFADGQTIQGSNDFAGKTFQIVNKGYNGGFWAIEISATVETN